MTKVFRTGRMLGCVATMMTVLAASAQDPLMYRGGPGHPGSTGALTMPISLKWLWTGEGGTKSTSAPAVQDGVAYFGNGGKVYAVNVATGAQLWEYPAGQNIPASFRLSPALAGGIVIVPASDASVYGISTDGRLAWQFNAHSSIVTAPTINGQVCYIGSTDGRVHALDVNTGNPVWQEPFDARMSLNGPVVYTGSFVLVMTEDGTLYGLTPATGKARFSSKLPGVRPDSYMAYANDQVYINIDSGLVAINPSNGRARWSKNLPEPTLLSPCTDGVNVFTVTQSGKVFGFESNGKMLWKDPIVLPAALQTSPVLSGGNLLVSTRRGAVMLIDTLTGKTKWSYILRPPTGAKVSSGGTTKSATYAEAMIDPVVANDTMMVLTDFGQLYAFSSKGAVDVTSPQVLWVLPEPGDTLSGRPPLLFQAMIQDMGSGIQIDSVQMTLDGAPIPMSEEGATFDPQRGLLEYRMKAGGTVRPLSDGRHAIQVRVKDWMGNETVRTWEITVNNTLQPTAPRSRNQDFGGG